MPTPAAKRLYTQAPEPVSEPVQTATIVVIQPGSYNLRIGRAADGLPITIPHCIARKKKDPSKPLKSTPWILRPECQHPESKHQQRQGLKQAEEALAYKPTSTGEYRQPTSHKLLYSHNSNVRGQLTEVICPHKWTPINQSSPYIIGEEALYLNPADNYHLHWPMRGGHLNVHDGPGGTLTAVMADIETIWGQAIQTLLDIPLKDLKLYKALLLIPDVYIHQHVKHMMDILLEKLGFGAAVIHQESVCATFGAGVGSACVVDVGDQKTSVCCVEDGISHKNTRITMEYGGSDITRCFHWLLGKSGFSPRELDPRNTIDGLLLQEYKESYCHLDQDNFGVKDRSILIRKPEQNIIKYAMKFGDETILAPMSVFFPDMLGLQGSNLIHVQSRSDGDPQDPHDEFFLRQTTSREAKLAKKKDNTEMSRDNSEANLGQLDDTQAQQQMDEDSNDAPDNLQVTGDINKGTRRLDIEEEQEMESEPVLQLMGVDQAILQSIDRCGSDEVKKKMYSCIIVVGGGMMFEEAQQWLQYRVWVGMPPQYRLMLETMDVLTRQKDMDPTLTCWKGASVLACLDTTQELWIKQHEWRQFSVRMLRERAPFMW
ncbi:actin-related protein 8-like [Pecten maximus]|uniref:actin-related protein 8-like n=1 Tax=Pecten maximus TaxID=6579 RepID=UPI00145814C7|nr:actin-related protein 8-like [Pecten maximus]